MPGLAAISIEGPKAVGKTATALPGPRQPRPADAGELKERIGHRLLDAVLVTTGGEAYRREDGIAVVPAALLGP